MTYEGSDEPNEDGEPDADFERALEMTDVQRAEWRRRDHEAEQQRIAHAKAEREKYDGRSRDECLKTATRALGEGKTQQQWCHEIDFYEFDLANEVWAQAVQNRANRIKFEEEKKRRIREDPAYQANLREWEEAMTCEERGESSPQTTSPSSPSRRPSRGRPGQRVAREPSAYPVPVDVEHTSGLIAAFDSGLAKLLGVKTFALWCYLLRFASPSERHRRVEGLTLEDLGNLIGITKEQARYAVARLQWTGMLTIAKPGRFGGGWAKGLTAVYEIPWPSTQRLDQWRNKLNEPTRWSQRIPRRAAKS